MVTLDIPKRNSLVFYLHVKARDALLGVNILQGDARRGGVEVSISATLFRR